MKIKEIQELLDFISNSGLAEVNIETEQIKLSVKKYQETVQVSATPAYHSQAAQSSAPAAPPSTASTTPASDSSAAKGPEGAKEGANLLTIKSPMIGTFYRSPNPESPFFVNVGDTISAGQTVCIIEAMKLFNEIESEVSGKVVKILVENSSPVEYDQPLFLVEPK